MVLGVRLGVVASVNSATGYVANASNVSGITAPVSKSSFVIAPASKGIFSAWVRIDVNTGTNMEIYSTNGTNNIARNTSNNFCVIFTDSTGVTKLDLSTPTVYTAGATWYNILSSWDLSGTPVTHLYINGVSDKTVNTAATTSDLTYAKNDYAGLGARATPDSFFDGCFSEIYFNTSEYLDLSMSANRDKFFNSGTGKPVSLGSNGSMPTGTAPTMYFKNPAASFGTNSGTGGNFVVTGSITVASTSPSD